MTGRDFWKERVNWEQDMTVREADSAGKIRYFEMKDRAEKNLAALKSSNKAS